MLSIVSSSLEALFRFSGYHTFLGGSPRVAEAMSFDRGERSRSPTRETLSCQSIVKATENKADNEGGNQPAPVEDQQIAAPDDPKKPDEEQPKAVNPATAAEETAGSTLFILKAVVTASKSMSSSVGDKCLVVGDYEVRQRNTEQPHSWSKLLCQCQYKAARASQASSQKAISWDWLSNSSDKVPMKDVVRSVRFHPENTAKASYELVAAAKDIVEVVNGQRELMTEQCALLKVIAENQQEVAKIMRGNVTQGFVTPGPPPEHSPPSVAGVLELVFSLQ